MEGRITLSHVRLLVHLALLACPSVHGFVLGHCVVRICETMDTGVMASAATPQGSRDRHLRRAILHSRPPRTNRPQQAMALRRTKVEITPDLIKKTAGLAQIQVTQEEVGDLLPRMEEFIGFVETMQEADTTDNGAFATLACGSDFLREDSAANFANVAAVMENMPTEEGSYLRVPKVGEDEG